VEIAPVTLRGRWLTLEPLAERHAPDLFEVMRDEEVCRYLSWAPPLEARGDAHPRPRSPRADGPPPLHRVRPGRERERCVGSTRLLDVRPADRHVEIGSTFLARPLWRTPANTESKYLVLSHCFEQLGCVRVALKTDARNVRSQEAIARLGASREGVLRKHMNVRGFQRDTVYYSLLDTEWPEAKRRLAERLYGSARES